MMEYMLLTVFYVVATSGIFTVIYRSYVQQGFSFHFLFSLIYVVTFFAGYPISLLLKVYFNADIAPPEQFFMALLWTSLGYGIYWGSYHYCFNRQCVKGKHSVKVSAFAKKQANLTAYLLATVAVISLGYFIYLNGLLLFRLEKYSQIFSSLVSGVALKRFFYFLLPALLIFYFLKPNKMRWWLLLFGGVSFGLLTYVAVGGTRANIALAVMLFILIGLYQGYLRLSSLFFTAISGVVVMFFLALMRYGLDVNGKETWFTFLYLTRDTFSPWENWARILFSEIEYQGLMPIIRDFYVYIPQSLWQERPDIVWNSANYFTKVILGNQSGLAISPTLLGSFYIMGGYPLIIIGMVGVGGIIKLFDRLFQTFPSALIQAYCLGNIFNLIVLVREGFDAFVSRFCFFSFMFGIVSGIAYIFVKIGIRDKHSG
ncbi:ECA oligosaccharide polymerase [Ursidibacter maritimus]|nr:ECA oligosaccharide polymerase [Ursidibacter maritimus]